MVAPVTRVTWVTRVSRLAGWLVVTGLGSLGATACQGSSSSGGPDGGNLSGLTPQQFVKAMAPGWNLGNTFDAEPNETSWGNPETTQAIVQTVHGAGFNTMRIPVTWTDHIGAAPAYAIDPAWAGMHRRARS